MPNSSNENPPNSNQPERRPLLWASEKRLIDLLTKLPESGMGYQIIGNSSANYMYLFVIVWDY
jgi:hypothetical protein